MASHNTQQKVVRLADGGHIINNWYNEWNKTPMDTAKAPVQAIEVDKNGKLVWQLRSWRNPDLGPSTTIQLLSEAVNRDRLFFGEYGKSPKPRLFVGARPRCSHMGRSYRPLGGRPLEQSGQGRRLCARLSCS